MGGLSERIMPRLKPALQGLEKLKRVDVKTFLSRDGAAKRGRRGAFFKTRFPSGVLFMNGPFATAWAHGIGFVRKDCVAQLFYIVSHYTPL